MVSASIDVAGPRMPPGDIDLCQYIHREMPHPTSFLRAAPALRVASDPTRARILAFLAGRPDLGASVTEVVEETGLGQPTVSHHLKVLFSGGLVSRDPQGPWVRYRLDPTSIRSLADGVARLAADVAEPPTPDPRPEAPGRLRPRTYPPRPPSGRPLPSAARADGG